MADDWQELATKIGVWLGLAAFCWIVLTFAIFITVTLVRWLV